jgi:hypothetical protein
MLPAQYLAGLSAAARRTQSGLIRASMEEYSRTGRVADRPRVSSAPTPRSPYVARFERRYGFPITDRASLAATFPDTDTRTILSKGAAAYASSGSRPNVSVAQWTNARLASVLTGGPSLRVDRSHVGPVSLQKIKGTPI